MSILYMNKLKLLKTGNRNEQGRGWGFNKKNQLAKGLVGLLLLDLESAKPQIRVWILLYILLWILLHNLVISRNN